VHWRSWVIELRYTSDDDENHRATVEQKWEGALASIPSAFGDADLTPVQIFSLRHDFRQAWAHLARGDGGPMQLDLSADRFP